MAASSRFTTRSPARPTAWAARSSRTTSFPRAGWIRSPSKVLALFPPPNNPGTGAGGLTNNYQRQEDRTFARDNVDGKVNWNRTSAHQIWGKFSYMNAVVDDLTNYLGPDPNASGDGGFTKVYQATGGQTWTLSPTMLMDMTFGYGRQDQHVYGPDFQAGNYGLVDARHPRHQRPGFG